MLRVHSGSCALGQQGALLTDGTSSTCVEWREQLEGWQKMTLKYNPLCFLTANGKLKKPSAESSVRRYQIGVNTSHTSEDVAPLIAGAGELCALPSSSFFQQTAPFLMVGLITILMNNQSSASLRAQQSKQAVKRAAPSIQGNLLWHLLEKKIRLFFEGLYVAIFRSLL